MKKIILASSSPRRKELLDLIKLPYIIHPSNVDESISNDLEPRQIVEELSMRKAGDIAGLYEDGIIIGSDTIVVLDDIVLGKPKDENDAFNMLKSLQGREHSVYSGITIIDANSKHSLSSYKVTNVSMKGLSDEDIYQYIATKEPMDKAGAYGIQGYGAILIDNIVGDYFNVVGLPLSLLATMLESFNINVMGEFIHS